MFIIRKKLYIIVHSSIFPGFSPSLQAFETSGRETSRDASSFEDENKRTMSQLTSKLVRYCNVGSIDFGSALKVQRVAVEKVRETNSAGILLLLEHTPVYTIGIRTKDYTKEDELRLIKTGAEYFKTNRGGLITFHGPGQLVVYPILNLKHFKTSMKWYICSLEKMVIDTCSKYGLNAATSPHTGVWIGDRKVCAIGVHGSRYITSHGIALNCNTNLEWFENIVPCGIPDKGVTSLSNELGRDVGVDDVRPRLLESFEKLFECRTECLKSVENLCS